MREAISNGVEEVSEHELVFGIVITSLIDEIELQMDYVPGEVLYNRIAIIQTLEQDLSIRVESLIFSGGMKVDVRIF